MPAPNILVVVVDGLRASALGAFGNTTFPTVAFDRFAADSLLFDWCYAPSVDLADIYRALWQSMHPARQSHSVAPQALPRMLAGRGYATTLVTDDPQLTAFTAAGGFDQCIQVHDSLPAGASIARASDISRTLMARLFASVCELIASDVNATKPDSPRLVWIHSRGMYGPWDAPLELQQSLLDDGDPPPVESVTPPDFSMSQSDDPDAMFRHACAYAAQAMVLDECWDGVLQAIESAGAADQWLVMLIGARGYPLGEHRRVGGIDPRLYSEQLHVPWLIRFPDGKGRLGRSGHLASHLDLLPTLLACTGNPDADFTLQLDGLSALPLATTSRLALRDALVASNADGTRSIRTAEWCFREDAANPSDERATHQSTLGELFVRPDDRWEANDVAKLCPEVVESLSQTMNEKLTQMRSAESVARAKN